MDTSPEPVQNATSEARHGIVVLTAQGSLSRIVVNGLTARLGPLTVIAEEPESRSAVIRRRMRLLGPIHAAGQVALGFALRLDPRRRQRLDRVLEEHALDTSPDPLVTVLAVPSVNSDLCRAHLAKLAPAVVAVYGTRLLKRETLAAVAAPFINYHAGITPKYRGQDPAYWALATGDAENAGVTIHLVDEGVDTGAVLYQASVRFAPSDTIATYQYVQAAAALPLFARAIEDALADRLAPRTIDLPSQKWFPPTLWGYLATGLTRGVW
ncbi:formyl transferase [Hyphomicrobium sp. LHD-15]|uniref:formyl transferase n=1 Tax=Hyphomicrobium sp. LHD-15 TaxID=3072142 RepID=UPI00280EC9A4|nr:formyl transferase [Hyphomicrobium sp. LHD-15]MDQ8700434.1 formyl transferase [Hyphomicrobium sp. LHD-15]